MHIGSEVFTGGSSKPVGVVGNEGGSGGVAGGFSKCPEMHRRVLEILALGEEQDHKQDKQGFHFSEVNYGYYWFFYLLNNGKPITVASR